jgi:hypothetical protein
MPTDLNILKKAFQNATATYESVSPGNEPLTRRESVQAEQVLGAPALPNDVGGWVASGGFPYQSTEYLAGSATYPIQTGAMPSARGYSETNPGAAGYPDVDFVPYNWGTNRFGNKGGALLGHPISWEVVGPTAKSPYLHWQWAVGGALNNTLTLEPGATTVALTGGAGSVPTVEDAYNLSVGGINDYNGGLYVLVTLTGGEADSTGAGALFAPADPLTPNDPATSSFEVFRVNSYSGQDIVLESSKLLSGYFGVPVADPKVRAITIIRPKVTRLAAFPLSVLGAQRNQVYVFLPPETAARSELLPPYEGSGSCPDWSVNGIGSIVGDGSYGGDAPLPVPLPLYRLYGYIDGAGTFLNQMRVYVNLGAVQSITQGQIVRVTSHARDTVPDGKESHVFGYFEATNTLGVSGTLDLRRVPEVNPATGEVFYGPGPGGGATDFVSVEVYDTISTVFTDPVLNVAKVAASRLDHLIDPRNAPYTFQRFSGTDSPVGTTTPPGASIFDTVTDSTNPGNLTGLGFRVVLFPAMDDGSGDAVPDFDNPITSERVVLDPSLSAATVQTIEVDYSAGVLYLSHQPVPGPGCTVAPGIYGTSGNNPRGEIVLFASCVPYSREETQRGGGIRVKATRPVSDLNPFGEHDAFDVYGKRCIATQALPGLFVSGTDLPVTLTTSETPPKTGWFYFAEVTAGTISSVSAPNYYPYFDGSLLNTVSVGTPGGYTITADTVVVFIKGTWNQVPTTDLWYAGTTRGASKRADAVNFKGANVSLEADGSVTVQTVATLDEAYRAGDPFTPGAGRVITVDGAAVEARPDASDNNDTFRSSFRVSVADVFGAKSLTGFDFKSDASTAALADPYAGFSDRRVFAPTAASTTLTPSFTVDVNVATVTATAGEFFWFAGSYDSTLLIFGHDLIEIEGVTYVIETYGATGDDIVIRNLDGTTPALTLTGVTATVYRPRLITNRGATGTPADNLNTWITAQEQSEASVGQPYGALNLYAGSATAIGAGDGGGSTAALAFWSRVATSGGSPQEALFSTMYFDTMGRLVSTLNPDFMQGGNLPDYTYRGDFATRAVKDTIFPAAPAFGHIVEEYTDVEARYDYLSLVPLIPGGATYNATATNVLTGQVTVTSVLLADLIPYGSAIFELTSVNGDTTKRGLFLITSGDGISVSPNTYFWLRDLNGTVGTLTIAPLLVFNGDTLTFRLHFSTSIGKRKDTPYLDTALAAVSHTPSESLGVGLETNAVGLAISAPIRYVGALNEDRHAYRVTTSTIGSAASPSNIETAALDVEGFHKAQDYLYLASRTITKQINAQLFQPVGSTGVDWEFDDTNGWWDSTGNSHSIKIPLDLPRSSDRTDSAGAKTHRTRLTSIVVEGQFYGGVGTEAILRIRRVVFGGLPPTRTSLFLGPAVAVQNYPLPATGVDSSISVSVWEDAAATVPVYIDNTSSVYYYIEIEASSVGGTNCLLYGVSVTYTDPGPKNY